MPRRTASFSSRALLPRQFRCACLQRCLLETLEPRLLLSSDVLVNHYDPGSTGQIVDETLLNPTTVGSTVLSGSNTTAGTTTNFGRVFDTQVDGQVYAQILTRSNVNITRGSFQGIHNVLYVATMHDSLYALDANTGQILWQDSFLNIADPTNLTPTDGVTTFPAGEIGPNGTGENAAVNGNDVGPELGIIATPTIDPATGIIYLVTDTQELRNGATSTSTVSGADWHFVERLWAINTSDGTLAITPPDNPPTSIEPATGGQIVGDTILNPTTAGNNPSFSSYTNYQYVAGPYIKGTGNNTGDTFNPDGTVATTSNQDGWISNSNGTSNTPWGTTNSPSGTGYIAFNAVLQMNRVATTLINGEIYLGFASHGDDGPYYGWLLGYNAATLNNDAAFVTIPNYDTVKGSASFTSVGGLWGSGATITTDGTYLYFAVGNGSFEPAVNNFSSNYVSMDGSNAVQMPLDGDYGDSILKVALDPNATQTNVNLANSEGTASTPATPTPDGHYNPDGGYNPNGYGLKVVDYFTPSNVWEMNLHDEDLGSSGVTVIPASGPGYSNPNGDNAPMLLFAGKEGRLYIVDSANLGGYNTNFTASGYELANPSGSEGSNTAADPALFDRVLGEFYYSRFIGQKDSETTPQVVVANKQSDLGYETPSYFNGNIYFGLSNIPELGFTVQSLFFPSPTGRTSIYATPNFTSQLSNGTTVSASGRAWTAAISGTDSSNEIIWDNRVNQTEIDATLTTAIASGATNITTLHVSPMVDAPKSGATLTLMSANGKTQSVTLSANASIGATTISVNSFTAGNAYPVGTPVLNNSTPDYLAAFASNGTLIFDSNWVINGSANSTSDNLSNNTPGATGAKFNIPTDFNGIIYLGTSGGSSSNISATSYQHQLGTVVGYGLLNAYLTSNATFFSAPSNLTTLRTGAGIQLTWSRNAADEAVTEVDRSTDGSHWSVLTYAPNGSSSYLDASAAMTTQYFYRVRAINGPSATAFSNSATGPAVLLGDVNIDGHVDGTDLSILLSHFGQATSAWTNGNMDGAPTIDLTDMADVLNNMGQSASITGAQIANVSARTPTVPLHTKTRPSPSLDLASASIAPIASDLTIAPAHKVHKSAAHRAHR